MPSFEDKLAKANSSYSGESIAFDGMKITDSSFLDTVSSREACPKCQKSRKFFCYQCFVPMETIKGRIPSISLPVKLEIIKHPKEVEGKSTAVHAAVIASVDTTVYTYPAIPSDYDKDKVVLVFPCETSRTLAQLAEKLKNKSEDTEPPNKMLKTNPPFNTVVFIESTWNQAHSIFTDERLKDLRRIKLEDYETNFWRYQRDKPANFLSTIEAIYWFYVEYDKNFGHGDSCYDDLLFFFSYMHSKIFKMYDGNLKVTEERRKKLAERQKAEAKAETKAEKA